MQRPNVTEYKKPAEFIKDMIRFRKATAPGFSVHQETKKLRKLSPALVSLVIQEKRTLTLERTEEFAKLLNLNASEKTYFRNWVGQLEDKEFLDTSLEPQRKAVGLGLLTDWLNVYVKDFFQLPAVQKNPELLEKQLVAIAPSKRVQKSVEFLLREGYLRKSLDGKIVLDTRLSIAEPKMPSRKIRQFHKGALSLAKLALDLFPPTERVANTMIIPLNEEQYQELNSLIEEFGEKLKDFAEKTPEKGNRLYQLIVNLSPIGGKLE